MYINYGDKNFFEKGVLVDNEHSDTVFQIIICNPYSDEENLYQFGEVEVDITDSWIDRKSVMDYIGMTEDKFDPIQYAIGCIEYYGAAEFGAISYAYDWMHMTKEDICDILKYRMIASDNLDIEW